MFSVGEYVIYASTGVCKIDDIRKENFGGERKSYYILKPVYLANSTIYAPVGSSEEKMKNVISKEEVEQLIGTMPEEEIIWIDDDNQRKEKFTDIVRHGDRHELIRLLKSLHHKQKEKLASGRKFHSADERIMKDAEKILFEEFALALKIKPEDVVTFISQSLNPENSQRGCTI